VSVAAVGRTAKTFTLTIRNRGAGRFAPLVVAPQTGVRDTTYTLTLKPS
jgi:hypothetical protein